MRNLFPIIFIIISIVLFFTVVNPMYSKAKKVKSDVSVYNTALTNATKLQKTRDDLVKNYHNVTDSDKIKLDHFLPNTVDNIQLILQIQNIATAHGLVLKNIKFDSASDSGKTTENQNQAMPANNVTANAATNAANNLPYGTFDISFSVDARYEDFISFLKDLETNIRLVNVKNISFNVPAPTDKNTTRSSGGEAPLDPSIFTYTLKVQTFWLK